MEVWEIFHRDFFPLVNKAQIHCASNRQLLTKLRSNHRRKVLFDNLTEVTCILESAELKIKTYLAAEFGNLSPPNEKTRSFICSRGVDFYSEIDLVCRRLIKTLPRHIWYNKSDKRFPTLRKLQDFLRQFVNDDLTKIKILWKYKGL